MGLEVYTIITDKDGKEVWNSADDEQRHFCGRYNETLLLFHFINTPNGDVDITDQKQYTAVEQALVEIVDKADRACDEAIEYIHDLREARKKAFNLQIFDDFSARIHEATEDYHDTYWTRAADMIELMHDTHNKMRDLAGIKPFEDDGDLKGYKCFWVISD